MDAIKPMQILMPIMVISSLSNITGMQILIPTGGEWKFAFSVTCGAITDLILNFMFIPKYGAIGAAYATLFAELVQFVAQLIFTRKYLKGSISWKPTLQVLLATVGGTIAFAAMSLFINFNAFMTLVVTAIAFFGMYAGILLIARYEMLLEMFNMLLNPIIKRIKK